MGDLLLDQPKAGPVTRMTGMPGQGLMIKDIPYRPHHRFNVN
jgi:hypothetical protein